MRMIRICNRCYRLSDSLSLVVNLLEPNDKPTHLRSQSLVIAQVSYSEMAVPASASLLDCVEIEFVVDFRNSSHDPDIFSFLHRNVGTVHSLTQCLY